MKKLICALSIATMISAGPMEAMAQRRVVKHVHKSHRGMSHKAKGALVGAGSGAAVGALTNGGKGAAVGAVIGAGSGYLIGRHQDKKHPGRKTVVKDKTIVRGR